MQNLVEELKHHIISALRIKDLKPDQLDAEAPLFGEASALQLDSIDALELMMMIDKEYGVKIEDPKEGRKILGTIQAMADFISLKKQKST